MANHNGRRVVFRGIVKTAFNGSALIFFVILLTIAPGATMAAEATGDGKGARGSWFTEAGFIGGYGDANLDEGVYRTLLIMGHLAKDITHFIPTLRDHRGRLSFFLEPQFNYVLKPAGEIEFGLGIGFQYAYPVTERISPYILLVTGPHYISTDSTTQARGFNFSSAFGVGIYLSLTKNTALNLGYRHRHVSNADIQKPNEGIDSEIGLLGLSYFF
ncbi:MAG: acyloxyacyl hydrolase [Syntrophales bacterium]